MDDAEKRLREIVLRDRIARAYTPNKPTAKQERFLALDCLEALYGGAAGGGKSDALLAAGLQYVHEPTYAALILRRSYADLALPGAVMDRSHTWLDGTDAKWDDTEKTWHFPSGAKLVFGYLQSRLDHLRYQSAEFQFCAFDELTQFPEHQYRYMLSRLRRKSTITIPLRMRAATNPGGPGHHWVKKRFIDEPEGRVFIPATLEDNPHVDAKAYELALSGLDHTTRDQLRHGSWVTDLSQLVYAFGDENICDELPPLSDGDEWRNILSHDYGNVDATAMGVICFCQHAPAAYARRSQQWADLAPSDAADITAQWTKDYGKFFRVVGDLGGLGKGYAAELIKRYPGTKIQAAQKSDKLGYIKLVNGDFEHKRAMVLACNEELIDNLRTLTWSDQWRNQENPNQENHLTDMLLYGMREARHYRATPPPDAKPPRTAADDYREKIKRQIAKAQRPRPWWEAN